MEQLKLNTNALEKLKIDNSGASMASCYPKNITLNIGGRKFQTALATLRAESGLLRRQLSESFTWSPEPDGSYFLDADPDLFEHLLRFMRRPNVFPLFYDMTKGFDHDLYNKLKIEAEFFQIDTLHRWIKNKNYLKAIKFKIDAPKVLETEDMMPATLLSNQSVESHAVVCTRNVYVCPRDIAVHRGNPGKCGAACMKAQGDDEDKHDDESYTEIISIKKTTEFDGSVCRLG